jgi:hypothetical protein
MGEHAKPDVSPDQLLARRETISRLFDDVAMRRREIVSEMKWTGEILRLSLPSLLDMLRSWPSTEISLNAQF